MSHKHKHYSRRSFLGQLGVGCAAVGATTLFSGITNMGLLNAAAAANAPFQRTGTYKALVCILLNGGNDSYNMLIPRGAAEYAEYQGVRSNLAIPQANLLPINPLNPDGRSYGLHPNLPHIQSLFENGNAAFVANVGAISNPTTVADYFAATDLPLGLYSHSDQQKHWQTCVPQDRASIGWGGRLADILHTNNSNQNISMNISLEGQNIFQRGNNVNGYSINTGTTGSVQLSGSTNNGFYQSLKRQTLDNMLDATYQNLLSKAYSNTVNNAIGSSLEFSSAIAQAPPLATQFGTDRLSQRLEMVAKTIAARTTLGADYQTFFVQLGGFDNHANNLVDHAANMTILDDAINSFYQALVEMGLTNDVTTFTMSDFGRKLAPNGDGTDHAWGGNSFVVGGAVNGQKIYGQFPSLYIGNPLDVGNGRLIPTTSCDEYFAELALWFGASYSDLDQILPNINNFWTPAAGAGPLGILT